MAYEMGQAANEFDLQEKLNAFILSIDGWQKIAQPSDFESVYYSTGEDGYQDIYIKTIAGLVENSPGHCGGNQRDFGDGYVGYLNFFAYQFYPEGGDGYDGYGEAGKYGPALFWINDDSSVYSQRFSQQSSGNRKWDAIGNTYDLPSGTSYPTGYLPDRIIESYDGEYDGRRFFYYYSISPDGFFRWNVGSRTNEIIDTYLNDDNFKGGLAHYIDIKTRKEYIWDGSQNDNVSDARSDDEPDPMALGHSLKRWDIQEGICEMGFQGPIWEDKGGGNYTADEGDLIWDGHNHLYKIRGKCGVGSYTQEWAKYHIPTNTWTQLKNIAAIPLSAQSLVWLDKNISGFNNHRIYATFITSNDVYYVDIDENSGLPVGSWTSAGTLPINPSTGRTLFHNNLNRWFYHPHPGVQDFYYAEMSAGSLTWNLVDASYMPTTTGGNSQLIYSDGYSSRVKTSIIESTSYWFLGSKDHIIVITKCDDDDQYSYCYMGAIDAFASSLTHATTAADIYPGTNVEIPITATKGEFVIGDTYSIVNVVEGSGGEEIGSVENVSRKFMPIETFTVVDVQPDVSVTADEIKNKYCAGSKIALDPQPVGITLEGTDQIQMLNSINTTNTSGGFDMMENIADLRTVDEDLVDESALDDRHQDIVALWPIIVAKTGDTAVYSGSEIRGSLIGIFAISGSAGISSGDTITVGPNTYIVFNIPTTKTYLHVFGPING